jgi:hypothetical protein
MRKLLTVGASALLFAFLVLDEASAQRRGGGRMPIDDGGRPGDTAWGAWGPGWGFPCCRSGGWCSRDDIRPIMLVLEHLQQAVGERLLLLLWIRPMLVTVAQGLEPASSLAPEERTPHWVQPHRLVVDRDRLIQRRSRSAARRAL